MSRAPRLILTSCLAAALLTMATLLAAQPQMPDAKSMSGIPRADTTVPVGTVSVRVVRGGFDKNIENQPVTFTIDGKSQIVSTDAEGRAQVSDIQSGATVVAMTVVDGERLETQSFTMGGSGFRIALVATDPEAKAVPALPAVKGSVVLGPESRVIVQLGEDGLNIFYLMDIVNADQAPVDIGGPLIFELPKGARRGSIDPETSTKQATVNGPRIIVTGPFQPGTTHVQAGYELPYRGPSVRFEQVWPAALQQLVLLVEKHGALEISSPQIVGRGVMSGQDRMFINATGPAIQAGQPLTMDITGLPYHSLWPRWIALASASGFVVWGLWAGVAAPARRRVE
jgi:hypothetical protein